MASFRMSYSHSRIGPDTSLVGIATVPGNGRTTVGGRIIGPMPSPTLSMQGWNLTQTYTSASTAPCMLAFNAHRGLS